MKLLFLFGDQAVGKMTVGQELTKITDMRLFHNHMTIEPVLEIFGGYYPPAVRRMRDVIFEEFAASGRYGLIFTYVWAFDDPYDWEYVQKIADLFRSHGGEVYYAELIAPESVRLARNSTENRLAHKPSKRDLVLSEQRLMDGRKNRCVSYEGEIPFENYIRIENTDIPAAEAARMIKERFGL